MMQRVMNSQQPEPIKPLMRGWSHGVAALAAIGGLVALMATTWQDPAKLASMVVYGAGLVLLFGVSATYHMVKWPAPVRAWLRRVDHATIFIFIAATYTPLVFNVLQGWWRLGVLVAIWTCAAAGAIGAAPYLRIPRRALTVMYVAMGWIAVVALAPLTAALGWIAGGLMAFGGIQYSIGAVFYATKRPTLWPRVFGYHELFHLAVISASITFYVIVFHYAVPYHRVG